MRNIILAKRNSAIFLSALLVLGTITTTLPTVQAQQYYKDKYNSADYQSHQDNRDYKSQKDSSVSINKIKCINNNLNVNGNNTGDINIGNKGQDNLSANVYGNGYYDGYGNNNKQGKNFDCIIDNNNNNTNIISTSATEGNQTTPPTPPTPNPKITVIKEMLFCSDPTVFTSTDGNVVFCREDIFSTAGFPDPDSSVWVPWEDCSVTDFCQLFGEENFNMQMEQNPGLNFINYEFPLGTNGKRTVNVDSGTYQISEEGKPDFPEACPNPSYDGFVRIDNPAAPPQKRSLALFCYTLEGDCSDTIEAGEEKICTVKNYFWYGVWEIPIDRLTASSNTNTAAGSLAVPFFSSTPPITTAQGIGDPPGLTAMEKINKLKTQWLDQLP